jgi:hypothetical protein
VIGNSGKRSGGGEKKRRKIRNDSTQRFKHQQQYKHQIKPTSKRDFE